jgi:hypothetical protein
MPLSFERRQMSKVHFALVWHKITGRDNNLYATCAVISTMLDICH